VHEAAYAQWFLSEVDQQAELVATLMEVEEALFNVFGQNLASGLDLEEQLTGVVPDDEIHSSSSDYDSVVGDGDLYLALEVEAALGEGQGEGALVIDLRAVEA
jgi:hypothetical protein